MVNKCILVGRLGKDPEVRYTGSGQAVANFSMATDETYKDRNGEKQKKTEWHKIVVWGKLASDVVGKYVKKGMLVFVEGGLQTRKWKDKEGNDRYTTEINCRNIRMLSGKGDGASRQDQEGYEDSFDDDPNTASGVAQPQTSGREISDEDIPF